MRTIFLTSSLLACALLSGFSVAATPKNDAPTNIKKVLETRYPQVKVVDVTPSPVAGLYEVFTGDSIVYASANGDFLLGGPLMSTADKRNVTAQRLDEHGSIDFTSLPLDLAIKTVKGNGRRTLAVFADPDCPFCKELEHSIAAFDDVTVYTFLFPLTSLHPDAANKARTIWCAEDRSQAWTQWMLSGTPAKAAEGCKGDPIEDLQKLGNKLRISSTPVVFFSNGRRVGGTLTAEQLKTRFDALDAAANDGTNTSSTQRPEGKTTGSSN